MAFQLSFLLASAYVNFSQRYFPTNIITNWMRQPGHLRYAWPLSIVLFLAYGNLAMWLDKLPAAETNGWLRLAIYVASLDGLKFASAFVFWPIVGALRGLRKMKAAGEGWLAGWGVTPRERLATGSPVVTGSARTDGSVNLCPCRTLVEPDRQVPAAAMLCRVRAATRGAAGLVGKDVAPAWRWAGRHARVP
ncbi:hypothetical protein [Xylanimonas protaetiae]|uniref:Uncharacterized protein n=1 Tax=Xylanimonas protaetiae TaxID=2509457 RepID=A0A4P6F026_9MICO|nr:hypothetical protein [Xylanimonas protaetiae]QAY68754.1 hypothetical protein ET471_00750 [Xylanimonas protaetiae]